MKNTNISPTLAGVFASLVSIWLLHGWLIVDGCEEQGGTYQKIEAQCILADGQVYVSPIENYVLALYFIVGFAVSFFAARLIKKALGTPSE